MKLFNKGYKLFQNFIKKRVTTRNNLDKNNFVFKETFFKDFTKKKIFIEEPYRKKEIKIIENKKSGIKTTLKENEIKKDNIFIYKEKKLEDQKNNLENIKDVENFDKKKKLSEKELKKEIFEKKNQNLKPKSFEKQNSEKIEENLDSNKLFEKIKKDNNKIINNNSNQSKIKKNKNSNNSQKESKLKNPNKIINLNQKNENKISSSKFEKNIISKKKSNLNLFKKIDLKIAEIESVSNLGNSQIYINIIVNIKNEKKNFIIKKKNYDLEKIKGKVIIIDKIKLKRNRNESEIYILSKKNSKNEFSFLKPINGKIGDYLREKNFSQQNIKNLKKNKFFVNKLCKFLWVKKDGGLYFDEFPLFLENGEKIIVEESSSIF